MADDNIQFDNSISDHLVELHKRSLGYAFGGPNESWCNSTGPGIELPIDANNSDSPTGRFRGCLKYSSCPKIRTEIKWKAWEDLNDKEREELGQKQCYRATRVQWDEAKKILVEKKESSWDINAFPSRKNQIKDAHWIANPFGIRTEELGAIINSTKGQNISLHRDITPCEIGGCVTPEMERDYAFERQSKQVAEKHIHNSHWKDAKPCPFYYRHVNEDIKEIKPNLQRFAQCYVTLPNVKKIFDHAGVILAAPIFRSYGSDLQEGSSYWYPFYSGFSFLQLLATKPDHESWDSIPFILRLQATTISRQNVNKKRTELPIDRLLRSVETGINTNKQEREERIFGNSEGFSSVLLLQWILIQRIKAGLIRGEQKLNISSKQKWVFEEEVSHEKGLVRKLKSLGYDMENYFSLEFESNRIVRTSTLVDDLRILGLVDSDNKVTDRFHFCFKWMTNMTKVRSETIQQGVEAFQEYFSPIISNIRELIKMDEYNIETILSLCKILVQNCLRKDHKKELNHFSQINLQNLFSEDANTTLSNLIAFEETVFKQICQLVPNVHIIVRAFGVTPVRWLFIPTGYDTSSSKVNNTEIEPIVHSGIIMLIKDDINSSLYDYEMSPQNDKLINNLNAILPFLILIADTEEENVREYLIKSREQLEFHQNEAVPMGHYLKLIRSQVRKIKSPTIAIVDHLLKYLERRYSLIPGTINSQKNRKVVSIDSRNIVKQNLQELREIYSLPDFVREKKIKIEEEYVGDDFSISILPITGYYDGENTVTYAENDFSLLISDLIIQRIASNELNILVRINSFKDMVQLEIITTKSKYQKKMLWKYPQQHIEVWPHGRGFHSTFLRAKNLGVLEMEVVNEKNSESQDCGVIRLAFKP